MPGLKWSKSQKQVMETVLVPIPRYTVDGKPSCTSPGVNDWDCPMLDDGLEYCFFTQSNIRLLKSARAVPARSCPVHYPKKGKPNG